MKPYVNPSSGRGRLQKLLLATAGVALALSANVAMAASGTAVGTTIDNIALLSYDVGGIPQNQICSSSTGNTTSTGSTTGSTCDGSGGGNGGKTSFLVDLKVNLTVVEANSLPTSVYPGATSQVTTFTVTNLSNSTLDFSLAANQVSSTGTVTLGSTYTDNFDSTSCNAYVDANGNGTYESGTDTATYIDELAEDASVKVFVVCNIPITQVNNDVAIVGLTATARGNMTGTNNTYAASVGSLGAALTATTGGDTANVDVVFADGTGSESGDGNNDAKYSARDAYLVQTSVLTVTKTKSLICDPVNGNTSPYAIPGSVVRWTLSVANTGSASATLSAISDALNTNTTFDPDLITGAGGASGCEYASGGSGTPESANGNGVKISTGAVSRPYAGSAAGTATSSFFTGASDTDGVTVSGGTLSINFTTAMPAGGAYTAGELKSGETVTVYFNVGVN